MCSVTYSFSNKRGNSYKETFAIDSQRYHKLKVGDVIDILYDPKYNKSVIPPAQVFGVYGDHGCFFCGGCFMVGGTMTLVLGITLKDDIGLLLAMTFLLSS